MTITVYAIHSHSDHGTEFCGVKGTLDEAIDFIKQCMYNDCDLPGFPTEPNIETTSSGVTHVVYPYIDDCYDWEVEPCTINLP